MTEKEEKAAKVKAAKAEKATKAKAQESLDPAILAAKKEAAIEIANLSVEDFKKTFASLYQKIATEVSSAAAAGNLKIAGFLLGVDDPFAEGAARVFAQQKGLKSVRLPIVLPYKDKASRKALESYIQRANGAGDTSRAKAAEKVMEKVK